jgi:hypothetical protein
VLRHPGTRRATVLPLPSASHSHTATAPSGPATAVPVPTPRPPGSAASAPAGGDAKRACFYGSVSVMQQVGQQVGRTFDCALVFNDATPNWTGWEHPWFIGYYKPDFNWSAWATAVPGRQLVITQRMIPDNPPSDWRSRGANGEYDAHAAELARSLVAAGLDHSVIRLGHEANGTWYIDPIGSSQSDYDAWRAYWARIVRVMRAVPGAHFTFDWCVNAGPRPIPFASWYPGDGVVDVIGADVYDGLAPNLQASTPAERWKVLTTQPGGLSQLIAFARSHHKPLSIPEWGLMSSGSKGGGGDDTYFVHAIAGVVRNNVVAYQSYFDASSGGVMLLSDAHSSLAAYRSHFGGGGDAVRDASAGGEGG